MILLEELKKQCPGTRLIVLDSSEMGQAHLVHILQQKLAFWTQFPSAVETKELFKGAAPPEVIKAKRYIVPPLMVLISGIFGDTRPSRCTLPGTPP